MSYIILIHGFREKNAGADSIDRAAPGLRAKGHFVETDQADYGPFGLLRVRFRRHSVINRIVLSIRRALADGHEVIVVGYSNGCSFGLKALRLVFVGQVKFIAVHPALPVRFKRPPAVAKAWVFYTRSDWAVRAATWVSWLVPGWGRAGAVGYKGDDPNIVSVDYTDIAARHGGLWVDGPLDTLIDDIHRIAQEDV